MPYKKVLEGRSSFGGYFEHQVDIHAVFIPSQCYPKVAQNISHKWKVPHHQLNLTHPDTSIGQPIDKRKISNACLPPLVVASCENPFTFITSI